ncbi:MAG: hypothetical protein MUF58_12260 [Arcicella sp.]|jgi:hypothetical protein|nr:hypothetical protein [Arcicella sp.]
MRRIVFLNLIHLLKEIVEKIEHSPKHYYEFHIPRKMRNKEYQKADLHLIQRIINKSIGIDESYYIIGSYGSRFDMSKNGDILALCPAIENYPVLNKANYFNKFTTIEPQIIWYNYELYLANVERKRVIREKKKLKSS